MFWITVCGFYVRVNLLHMMVTAAIITVLHVYAGTSLLWTVLGVLAADLVVTDIFRRYRNAR